MRSLSTILLLSHLGILLTGNGFGAVQAFAPLAGVQVTSVGSGDSVDLGSYLSSSSDASPKDRTLLILGTYAADFNAIEYAQRLRYYLPQLRDQCGVNKFGIVLNCQPDAANSLATLVDLDLTQVDLFVDPLGAAGRKYGVERGWLPDNPDVNPFLKLFAALWGLGAWATLPAVIGGYIGNPFTPQPWIQDALQVGQKQDRWPNNALELDPEDDGNTVLTNKFAELPYVGSWERRPLELATLRLQSMLGISLKEWKTLAPEPEALDAGVLTQLGACLVVEGNADNPLYQWKDPGICAVANFEDMVKKLKTE